MIYPYRYAAQFERYIGQFMRVFTGFQTRDGVERDGSYNQKRVPVVYGGMDRIVASVIQERGALKNNRIPIIAVNLEGIEMDPERKMSPNHIDTMPYDDDGVTNHYTRLIGPPFRMNMSVAIYASSTSEMFSIVEQILLIFNPRVTIYLDNNIINGDYITELTLESIQDEIQYPMGQNHRVVMQSMNFTVPVRLRYPHDGEAGVIEEIIANILIDSENSVEPIEFDQVIITGNDVEPIDP